MISNINDEDLDKLYTIFIRINKISQNLSDEDKKIFDCLCGDICDIYLLIKDYGEEFEEYLSKIEAKLNIKEEEEEPMVLSPFSKLTRQRGIALSQALSSEANAYLEGLQRAREARYQSMIEESTPIESPMTRRLG